MKIPSNKKPRCMDEILTRDLISSLSKGRLNREQTKSMLESLYKTAFEDGAKTAERVTTEYLVLHFCQTLHYVFGFGAVRLRRLVADLDEKLAAFDVGAYDVEDMRKALKEDAKFEVSIWYRGDEDED